MLRFEDIDRPRVVAGSQARIEADLRWLGLDWDEGPYLQSERSAFYERAIGQLAAKGLVYPCDCSRAEIGRVASAPHAGEEAIYPGTCRGRDPRRSMKRAPALRVRVPDRTMRFRDEIAGDVGQELAREVGDFVLRRGDGIFAYQLAVVVDDLAMDIDLVVRGADLLASTPRQIWLAEMLGVEAPRYAHVPLLLGPDGLRLEKRTRAPSVAELRAAGVSADRIVGEMAYGLGLAPTTAPTSARAITDALRGGAALRWRGEPWRVPTF